MTLEVSERIHIVLSGVVAGLSGLAICWLSYLAYVYYKNLEQQSDMKLSAIGAHILVEPEEASAVSKGGVLIPDQAKEKPLQGVVRSIGMDIKDGCRPANLQVGDVVYFGRYAGIDIEHEGRKYKAIAFTEVVVKVEK